jgi:DNA recombination-dependent growth factor C
MPAFRKSGSFVRFYVDGDMPAIESDEFLMSLAQQRFRTIEGAASEETSAGWVCPSDPSGDDFLREELACDDFARLRIRVDKKKLPPVWLKIYLDAEIKARGGKRPSAKERKEIKEDIAEKLLPRMLPSVQFLDVLYSPREQTVYLFSSSQSARETCMKLFYMSFNVRLKEAGPFESAFRLKLPQEQLQLLEESADLALFDEGELEAPASSPRPNPAAASSAAASSADDEEDPPFDTDDDMPRALEAS